MNFKDIIKDYIFVPIDDAEKIGIVYRILLPISPFDRGDSLSDYPERVYAVYQYNIGLTLIHAEDRDDPKNVCYEFIGVKVD